MKRMNYASAIAKEKLGNELLIKIFQIQLSKEWYEEELQLDLIVENNGSSTIIHLKKNEKVQFLHNGKIVQGLVTIVNKNSYSILFFSEASGD